MKLIIYLSALLLTSSIFAIENCHEGIYNASTRVSVCKPWRIFLEGSFIYWQAREEGLDIAVGNPTSTNNLPSVNSDILSMGFKYKPGFKVGIGYKYDFDQMIAMVEYTRFHQMTNSSSTASNIPTGSLRPIWLIPGNTSSANATKAEWKLDMDMIDGSFSRMYMVGKRLYFKPFFGLRAAWIDQQWNADYFVSSFFVETNSKSDSWAIGPRTGIDSNWLWGVGFYGVGNVSASLLYTRYRVQHIEKSITDPNVTRFNTSEKIDTLRPNLEFNLGFGWGTYFIGNKFHIDLKARYDFLLFFYQNMMRNLNDMYNNQFTNTNTDLYLHGLTVKAQFDF